MTILLGSETCSGGFRCNLRLFGLGVEDVGMCAGGVGSWMVVGVVEVGPRWIEYMLAEGDLCMRSWIEAP